MLWGASRFLTVPRSQEDEGPWWSWGLGGLAAGCVPALTALSWGDPLSRTIQYAVPLKLKCLFPLCKKSKSHYSELSFEKSIHPLKFMDSRFQIAPPLAGSQVTALYNPSLNNIHHDKWHHNSDIHNQSLL